MRQRLKWRLQIPARRLTVASMTASLTERVTQEIRAEMGRQRLSGRQLAQRLSKPTSTVNRWLACATPISIEDMDSLARALQVRADDLVARANRRDLRPVDDATGVVVELPRLDLNQQPFDYKSHGDVVNLWEWAAKHTVPDSPKTLLSAANS